MVLNDNVTIEKHEFSDNALNITIGWQPPAAPNGDVIRLTYDIVISDSPLEPNATNRPMGSILEKVQFAYMQSCLDSSDILLLTHLQQSPGNITIITIATEFFRSKSCVYVQVN